MRTKTLLLTAALAAAGVASSMAQGTVFSVNAVGYVNTTLKKGFNLIANPLNAGADNTIGALFKGLPLGTQVYKFNGKAFDIAVNDDANVATGAYESSTPAMLTAQILPGEGLFVKNNTQVDQTVTFVGEVPQGNLSNPIPAGLSIRSSQVPQDGKITTDLKFPAKAGDQVSKWDAATQKFIGPFTFDPDDGGWGLAGVVNEPSLTVGESVFVRKVAADTWTRTFNVN